MSCLITRQHFERVDGFVRRDKFKDYGMNGVKDNVPKIYAELKK